MQVSKAKIDKKTEKQVFKKLYQVLADLRRPEEVEKFLEDVLTKAERLTLAKRLAIAVYLVKGKSYETIRNDLKVSSATIAAVQNMMEKGGAGFSLAVERIEADEWAEEWVKKLKGMWQKVWKKERGK